MRNLILGLLLASGVFASRTALANNTLTSDQLQRAIQVSVIASKTADPGMANSISGLRVVTVGATAQVTVEMKADGMNMSSKYLCVPQAQDMACRVQQ